MPFRAKPSIVGIDKTGKRFNFRSIIDGASAALVWAAHTLSVSHAKNHAKNAGYIRDSGGDSNRDNGDNRGWRILRCLELVLRSVRGTVLRDGAA